MVLWLRCGTENREVASSNPSLLHHLESRVVVDLQINQKASPSYTSLRYSVGSKKNPENYVIMTAYLKG